jgi:hypothetical protein
MEYEEPNAVQVHASLDDIEPLIWRRLVVPRHFSLRELHLVLQAAFGWIDAHLHEFVIGGLHYGDPKRVEEWEGAARTFDEGSVLLRDFTREPGTKFTYVYDMGDNWVHSIVLKKHEAVRPPPKVAICTEGARARPPEDVGGTSGYQDFLEALLDRHHEEHAQMTRWCGGHFDPAWFDLELINKDVVRALKPNVKRRLHQPKPVAH